MHRAFGCQLDLRSTATMTRHDFTPMQPWLAANLDTTLLVRHHLLIKKLAADIIFFEVYRIYHRIGASFTL
jgi:hypothetical protein